MNNNLYGNTNNTKKNNKKSWLSCLKNGLCSRRTKKNIKYNNILSKNILNSSIPKTSRNKNIFNRKRNSKPNTQKNKERRNQMQAVRNWQEEQAAIRERLNPNKPISAAKALRSWANLSEKQHILTAKNMQFINSPQLPPLTPEERKYYTNKKTKSWLSWISP
jgi:hypothetical protein